MADSRGETEFYFEPLTSSHDRAVFACGVPVLDRYLQRQAHQDMKRGATVVYVLTPDGITIVAYYTLSQYSIKLGDLPAEVARKLPKYPEVPSTLLGRLAVSEQYKGRRFGELVLMHALGRSLFASKSVASVAVVVDAKDDGGASFYKKYGFIEFPTIPRKLFIPMATIAEMHLAI